MGPLLSLVATAADPDVAVAAVDDVVLLNYALGNGTCFESARAILVTEVHRRTTLSRVDARMTFCHFDCPSSYSRFRPFGFKFRYPNF